MSFRANTSINEAVEIIAQGRALLHSVTIPEGLTSYQIVNLLNENEILSGEIQEIPEEGLADAGYLSLRTGDGADADYPGDDARPGAGTRADLGQARR